MKNIATTPSSSSDYLDNNTENPYARMLCRARRLTPTMCDGTCLDCKKNRDDYKKRRFEQIRDSYRNNPRYGSFHDTEEIPTDETMKRQLKQELDALTQRKKQMLELKNIANERMCDMQMRALSCLTDDQMMQ